MKKVFSVGGSKMYTPTTRTTQDTWKVQINKSFTCLAVFISLSIECWGSTVLFIAWNLPPKGDIEGRIRNSAGPRGLFWFCRAIHEPWKLLCLLVLPWQGLLRKPKQQEQVSLIALVARATSIFDRRLWKSIMKYQTSKKLNHAASHDENRSRVCFLCLKKNQAFVQIKNSMKLKLETLLNFAVGNNLPNVLCIACKIKLSKVEDKIGFSSVFQLPDYSGFQGEIMNTRGRNAILS